MNTQDIRVVVVDDQQLIRESIGAMLNLQPGILVVGLAGDGDECLEVVESTRPDVVLMDVRMPRVDGVRATLQLRHVAPQARVIMLTTFDDEAYVRGALANGAVGYLLKDRPVHELAAAVRTAFLGVAQMDPAALALLATPSPRSTRPPLTERLTERELQVLRCLAAGATNREIARSLYLSEGTVKNHVSRILERLGLRRRAEAAVYARDHGLG